jgi:hypothetical protein
MTKRALILLAFATGLILAPLFSVIVTKAYSQQADAPRGPFMLAAAGNDQNSVWRIDQASGRVSYCSRSGNSLDPVYLASKAPFCSGWSQ